MNWGAMFQSLWQGLLFQMLGELLRPSVKRSGPAAGGLKDLSFPTSDPNRAHQWLIGRRIIDNANLFATWDFKAVPRSKRVRTGLIKRETFPLPPVYYVSFGMVLCGGSGARLKRLYLGDRLAWEGDIGSGETVDINLTWNEEGQDEYPRGMRATVEFYSGATMPSPYVEAKQGVGTVPAWSHLTYIVVRGQAGSSQPGAYIGTNKQVEHLRPEIERMPSAATTGLGEHPDGGSYWVVDGDANPAYACAEIMVEPDFGAGLPTDTLDAAAFHAAAKKLYDEGHGTSQQWDSQRPSGEVVIELCRQTGAILQPDATTGLQQMRLMRGEDAPLLTLNDDNIERLQSFSRSAMSEATNALTLTYIAKNEKFEPRPVEVQDLAAVEAAGQVITGQTSYAGIMNSDIALKVGVRDLRALSAPLASARVSAIVPKRARLLPGDPVLFASPLNGIEQLRMRVVSSRYSKPGTALCEIELLEDVFFSGAAIYSVPAPATGGTGSSTTSMPVAPSDLLVFNLPAGLAGTSANIAAVAARRPDDATTNTWTVAYGLTADSVEYNQRSDVLFSARGLLASTLPSISAAGSITISLSARDYAALQAAGAGTYDVLVAPGNGVSPSSALGEWMRATCTPVGGNSAVLTAVKRGLYDTVPASQAAGAVCWILIDYVTNPAPMRTTITTAMGATFAVIDGVASQLDTTAYERVYPFGKNVRGVAGPGAGQMQAVTNRASRLASLGKVGLRTTSGEPQLGASTPADAPMVTLGSGTIYATWGYRSNSTSDTQPWAEAAAAADPGVRVQVRLERYLAEYDEWQQVGSGWYTATEGATSVAITSTSNGKLRLTAQPFTPVGSDGDYLAGASQTWYFNKTA